ncbi:type IV toxin-antitoxin system AbiEi family antitoxin [Pseudahrensia aquimaris]|uniref:Type IV toxin-antitoxin system AbiEi family antitoxin n=1 Tax=Pseudahrensia aquimaris TaxID=744461 RepID=A0ABW3FED9_9HYPH
MKTDDLVSVLDAHDPLGKSVFTKSDLRGMFPENEATLSASLRRMVTKGVLTRVAPGVYYNSRAEHGRVDLIEGIAVALRPDAISYISLESALSQFGIISQILVDRITVMTTGRGGEFKTPYVVVEFTHTKRRISDVFASSHDVERPLRFAAPDAALRDLKRVGRNAHMVSMEDYHEVMADYYS